LSRVQFSIAVVLVGIFWCRAVCVVQSNLLESLATYLRVRDVVVQ
jgi:hypothetical protein